METIHAGLFSWRPLTLKLCYRSQRRSVHLSLLISPNARFPLRSNLLEHSSSSFRRKPILSNNPKFAVARVNAGAGINGEIAALEADGSNGALQEDFTSGFFQQLSREFAVVLSFLPGGSWWKVGDAVEDDSRGVTLITALRRIWALIASDKIVLFAAFSTLLMAAISEISIPHFVAATVFAAQSQSKVLFYRNAKLLVLMCCSFGIFSGIRSCCFGIVNQILVRRMREKLFSTILSQDIAFFDIETVGVLTSRLGSDCQQVSGVIGNDLNIILRNGLQGTGALLYLVMLSWRLALTTVLLCSLMSTIMLLYSRYQRNAAKCSQEVVAEANDVAQEALSLVRVVRTFGTEAKECERYSKWLKKLEGINLRQNVACGFWKWSSNTLYHAAQVVALLVGGGFVMDGHITAEQLTKFIMYSEWVMHSAWWVGDYWSSLMQSIGASEKVFELIELPLCKQVTSQGLKLRQLEGRIEFVNISFNYPSRPMVPVLQNINLSICPGELVAVVGLSGSGKSTLLGLLLRLYEAASGQILIDGIPLNELDVKWFRSKVGVVSQEPRLFNMDIASNISYGCVKKFGQRDIEWAAKQADAHEFIMSLPDGYKTLIDNARLSGGQKQRIAIARAVLREPTILVLDEATSALDAESENYVKQAIERIVQSNSRRKCTVLVITHRLSTICTADRIVVMKSGKILEMGSHDELLQKDGEYAKLTRRQLSSTV